jgi:DNA-3-methyladenine glycosylase II
MPVILPVPKRYNMFSSVHAWIFPDVQPVPEKTWNQCYSRIITSDENTQIPVIIKQMNPGENLCIHFPNHSIMKADLKNKIQSMFCLSVDTEKALSVIRNEPVLCHLTPLLESIKPYLTDTLYEALMKSIIQQQISYRVANMLTKRIILGFTKPMIFDNTQVYHFPNPKRVLEMNVEQLRAFGLGKKSEYIIQISSSVISGDLDLNSLRNSTYEEITEVLNPIKGIGTWTIDAFCIAGLGKFSIFPYGDIGTRNLLGRLYGSGTAFSKKEVIAKSESWGSCGPMILYLLMCAEVLGLIRKQSSENA